MKYINETLDNMLMLPVYSVSPYCVTVQFATKHIAYQFAVGQHLTANTIWTRLMQWAKYCSMDTLTVALQCH